MSADRKLLAYGAAVLALNVVVLTPIALLANLPSQFGGVGTDAAAEFAIRGTAISAPAVTLAVLALALGALRMPGTWATSGTIAIGLVGILMIIGAFGEAFSTPTADVSKQVLVTAGIVAGALGTGMVALSAGALSARPGARPRGPEATARL